MSLLTNKVRALIQMSIQTGVYAELSEVEATVYI